MGNLKGWHLIILGALAYLGAKVFQSALRNWFGVTSI